MDPVTHILLGATVGQLGFRRRIGRDAPWLAGIAAALPDLDILLSHPLQRAFSDPELAYLFAHRGISHSLLMAPLIALPIAALWKLGRRTARKKLANPPKWVPFRWLFLCILAAIFSHNLLDWCTAYGTELFAPITTQRYALDLIPIIDPIISGLLLLTLIGCGLAKLGDPKNADRRRQRVASWGFGLFLAYMLMAWGFQVRAERLAVEAVGGGPKDKIVRAYPCIGSILLWRVTVETPEGWYAVRIHQFSTQDPGDFRQQYARKIDEKLNPWITKTKALGDYPQYAWFSDGQVRGDYRTVRDPEKGLLHVVTFHDMRYSLRPEDIDSPWPLVAVYDAQGKRLSIGRRSAHRSRKIGAFFAQLWDDLANP